ncbi:MAG TPA: zinc ribbon domain-containing protein [Blastocatellia bacterium]|nr:zinc ribbon domain-containing protein [Blastocatellia bacterium]
MFCPRCGSKQSESGKFCTHCGTNLALVSQALTGQQHSPTPNAPSQTQSLELGRRHELTRGYRFALIGLGFVFFGLIKFIRSGASFEESAVSAPTLLAVIFLIIGISKILGNRVSRATRAGEMVTAAPPQPILSPAPVPVPVKDQSPFVTNEFEIPQHPRPSVTEDETLHLPSSRAPRKYQSDR